MKSVRRWLRSGGTAIALLLPLMSGAQLVEGLQGASGSTVGPDGALYVTEGLAGRVSRVDPRTGRVTTYAEGLPLALIGIGGAIDVTFVGGKAYVLVTLVGAPFGTDVDGIYRVDEPNRFTVIADLGGFSAANPPATPFDLSNGLQYTIERYRGGFLVTDGHHNRILRVSREGEVSEFVAFGNVVPTGLAVAGNTVYMAEAGPVPHLPSDGKVVKLKSNPLRLGTVASGAPLLVDVEFGRGRTLFALSQGSFPQEEPLPPAGSPALPNTGVLLQVTADCGFRIVEDGLNLPTSLEIIGNTAYVVTLTGEIRKIPGIAKPPFGKHWCD